MAGSQAEQQARFFAQLQTLLVEGQFVSTYKYALLISLARWAVEHPDHDTSEPVDVAAFAPHFLELYLPQALPFRSADDTPADAAAEAPPPGYAGPVRSDELIAQDRGRHQTPRILKQILEQAPGHSRLQGLTEQARDTLLGEARRTIATMPLWKLQVIGNGSHLDFLYEQREKGSAVLFHPGMVRCLARFAPLIEQLVRAAWIRFVLRWNGPLLGASIARLEDHLFPGARRSLDSWREPLREMQSALCFYCQGRLDRDSHVDHFIPWSRYPRDLGHNFVLAHASCNASKSDHLASVRHLERWRDRNDSHGAALEQTFGAAGVPQDRPVILRVAWSVYDATAESGARVWQDLGQLVPLDPAWRDILAPSA